MYMHADGAVLVVVLAVLLRRGGSEDVGLIVNLIVACNGQQVQVACQNQQNGRQLCRSQPITLQQLQSRQQHSFSTFGFEQPLVW